MSLSHIIYFFSVVNHELKSLLSMEYLHPHTTLYDANATASNVLNEVDFEAVNVCMYTRAPISKELCVILRYNKEHNNLCTFVGEPKEGETVKDTAVRKITEQTNEIICRKIDLSSLLCEKCTDILVTRSPTTKPIYTLVVDVSWSKLFDEFKNREDLWCDRLHNSYDLGETVLVPAGCMGVHIVISNLYDERRCPGGFKISTKIKNGYYEFPRTVIEKVNENFDVQLLLHPTPLKEDFMSSYKSFDENGELIMISFTQLKKAYKDYKLGETCYLNVDLVNGPHRCELNSLCVSTLYWLCNTK